MKKTSISSKIITFFQVLAVVFYILHLATGISHEILWEISFFLTATDALYCLIEKIKTKNDKYQ